MKALTALFIIERIFIIAFVVLLGAKLAVYCSIIEKDFSWYYVLSPVVGIILLVPLSMVAANHAIKNATKH